MDNQDEDDLKEVLERCAWVPEALHDLGIPPEPCCKLEANGFANIIILINCMAPEHRLLCGHLREQAEIGLKFIDMHNAGLKPKWHEARMEYKLLKGEQP